MLFLVSLFAVADVAAYGENVCRDRPCIQVGVFNLEWFGTERRGPRSARWPLRSARAVKQIARLVTDTLDLEVVVLLEINTWSNRATWLVSALEEKGYESRWTGNPQQNIVIAFDTQAVKAIEPFKALPSELDIEADSGCNLRSPVAQRLRAGKFDFYVVGVHLAPLTNSVCAGRVRTAQAVSLAAQVGTLAKKEGDVVVMGDFGAAPAAVSLAALLEGGLKALTEKRYRSKPSYNVSALNDGRGALSDHLMTFAATRDAEWVGKSTMIFSPPSAPALRRKYLRYTSDHVPVWTSFYTDEDID